MHSTAGMGGEGRRGEGRRGSRGGVLRPALALGPRLAHGYIALVLPGMGGMHLEPAAAGAQLPFASPMASCFRSPAAQAGDAYMHMSSSQG